MAVLNNYNEIPVPSFAYVNKKTQEVSAYYKDAITGSRRRYVIGRAIPGGNMIPTTQFRTHFPELWAEAYGEEYQSNGSLHVGLHASALHLATASGLYQSIQAAFGNNIGNAYLDYSMWCLQSDPTPEAFLSDHHKAHATFSTKPKSESWYTNSFNTTRPDALNSFKSQWVNELKKRFDINSVWLSISAPCADAIAAATAAASTHPESEQVQSALAQSELSTANQTKSKHLASNTSHASLAMGRILAIAEFSTKVAPTANNADTVSKSSLATSAEHSMTTDNGSSSSRSAFTSDDSNKSHALSNTSFDTRSVAGSAGADAADAGACIGANAGAGVCALTRSQSKTIEVIDSTAFHDDLKDDERHEALNEDFAALYSNGIDDDNSSNSSSTADIYGYDLAADDYADYDSDDDIDDYYHADDVFDNESDERDDDDNIKLVPKSGNIPLTWFTYDGDIPSLETLKSIIDYLATYDIKVKGVIFDENSNSQELIKSCSELGLEWLMQLQDNNPAMEEMHNKIPNKPNYDFRNYVRAAKLFAITDRARIFEDRAEDFSVSLFYDAFGDAKHADRFYADVAETIDRLQAKLYVAVESIASTASAASTYVSDSNTAESSASKSQASAAISSGRTSNTVSQGSANDSSLNDGLKLNADDLLSAIPEEYKDLIYIEYVDGDPVVKGNGEKIDAACFANRYQTIASSQDLNSSEKFESFSLSSTYAKAFAIALTEQGFKKRSQTNDAIAFQSRLACGFIACVLKGLIEHVAKTEYIPVHDLICGLADICVIYASDHETFVYDPSSKKKYQHILDKMGITKDVLKLIAAEAISGRDGRYISPTRSIPLAAEDAFSYGLELQPEPTKEEATVQVEKRKPGRPKGSKNQKTLEREAMEALLPPEARVKRGRGRPKGSKNKKTLALEALAAEQAALAAKRGPGRPKGSKNKTTLEREAQAAAQAALAVKRGRGRPKGSKNKKTLEREAQLRRDLEKRGPGRPKGSKNKTTL